MVLDNTEGQDFATVVLSNGKYVILGAGNKRVRERCK